MALPEITDHDDLADVPDLALMLIAQARQQATLERIESTLGAFVVMLEEFRPLLDKAKARVERGSMFGRRPNE